MVYERTYEHLAESLASDLDAESLQLIRRAHQLAETVHANQMRDEGTPYILHPVRVAISLVDELAITSPTLICSALLHDVIEDSPEYHAGAPITRDDIAASFGEEIAEIVWLLTKLEEVPLPAYLAAIEAAAETGAPVVKLCDRLDNLRFLTNSPKLDKIRRYIRTTEIFYLPMAARTNAYLYSQLTTLLDEARAHLEASR